MPKVCPDECMQEALVVNVYVYKKKEQDRERERERERERAHILALFLVYYSRELVKMVRHATWVHGAV